MSISLGKRLLSLLLVLATALTLTPVAGVARHEGVSQTTAEHTVFLPFVSNGEFRLERNFPKYGGATTDFRVSGDQVVQTWNSSVNLQADKFIVVPVENGSKIPLPIATAVVTRAVPIGANTPLGSTVTVSGQGTPAGVVFFVGLAVATVGYAIYKSAQGQLLGEFWPAPNLEDSADWAHERSAMLEDQTKPESRPNVMSALTTDPPDPDVGPPCQPFINISGGRWPSGWRLEKQVVTRNLVRVRFLDGDTLVGYAEARKVGVYGHLYAWVSKGTNAAGVPYRHDYIATVLLQIAGDIYTAQNGTGGKQLFIVDDLMNRLPWSCLKAAWPILRIIDQWASIHQYSSFRAAAARLGIPPYLP